MEEKMAEDLRAVRDRRVFVLGESIVAHAHATPRTTRKVSRLERPRRLCTCGMDASRTLAGADRSASVHAKVTWAGKDVKDFGLMVHHLPTLYVSIRVPHLARACVLNAFLLTVAQITSKYENYVSFAQASVLVRETDKYVTLLVLRLGENIDEELEVRCCRRVALRSAVLRFMAWLRLRMMSICMLCVTQMLSGPSHTFLCLPRRTRLGSSHLHHDKLVHSCLLTQEPVDLSRFVLSALLTVLEIMGKSVMNGGEQELTGHVVLSETMDK
eukprot:6201167-Pleurochrysis_carterae.AAC.7